MKITLDFPIDRHDWLDDDGNPPSPEVTDKQLLLWTAQSDYKQFAFEVADAVLQQLQS